MDKAQREIHERVKAIFAQASELGLDARRAFVEANAGGNAEVVSQVMRLLEAADGPEQFLRQPTAAVRTPPSPSTTPHGQTVQADGGSGSDLSLEHILDERAGSVVGPYTLLQSIGEGGFGRVFMAEQQVPVRRRVAFKIIKLGMDTRQVVARFEQERQALALMDHPHIAKVLDGGATPTGRPYFVMELVSGEWITRYSDDQHLSVSDRLRLFVQVCRAVQHAHQKGIIHRDIKPSNVLVSTQDGRAFAKVIDFGIAKATQDRLTERTLFTEHKQPIGTPEYMSPEQAEASVDIDTRTDVYSLGVLLYELLTGSTPFDIDELRSATFADLQRMIREVEPPTPSNRISQSGKHLARVAATRGVEPKKLNSIVRGELDWIVMKALEKDRARRYDSANSLADDIEKFLSGQAVLAAPPSAVYRARKFVRRNRGTVFTGVFVAIALLFGAIGTSFGFVQASQERDEAKEARDDAEAVTAFLTKVLSSADPKALGKDVTVRQLIDNASKKLDPSIESRPKVEGKVRYAIAETYLALGEIPGAQSNATRAMELSRKTFGDESEQSLRAQELIARVEFAAGDYPGVEKMLGQLIPKMTAQLGPQSEVTLSARNVLAYVHANTARFAESEAGFRTVIDGYTALKGPNNENTLSAQGSLALVLAEQGKFAEADSLYLKVGEQLAATLGPDHPTTLSNLSNYAWSLEVQQKNEQAAKLCEQVYEARRRVLGEDHPETSQSANNLAILHARLKRTAEAAVLHESSLATERRLRGSEHPQTLISIANLAKFYMESGSPDKALPLFVEAEAGYRKVQGSDHLETGATLLGHGICLRKLNRPEESAAKLTEAFAIVEKFAPQRRSIVQRAAQELVLTYEALGKPDEVAKWKATVESLKKPAP
jgi:eukaryotic-like serine/threonine-protein kinase